MAEDNSLEKTGLTSPDREPKVTKVVYTAFFVDDSESLLSGFSPDRSKHPNIFAHHSTIQFMPGDGVDGVELGKKEPLSITGRVTDDDVDVLLVNVPNSKNKYPHITLATAEGVSPVQSNEAIEKAVETEAVVKASGTILTTVGAHLNVDMLSPSGDIKLQEESSEGKGSLMGVNWDFVDSLPQDDVDDYLHSLSS